MLFCCLCFGQKEKRLVWQVMPGLLTCIADICFTPHIESTIIWLRERLLCISDGLVQRLQEHKFSTSKRINHEFYLEKINKGFYDVQQLGWCEWNGIALYINERNRARKVLRYFFVHVSCIAPVVYPGNKGCVNFFHSQLVKSNYSSIPYDLWQSRGSSFSTNVLI